MAESTINAKGQTTVPADILQSIGRAPTTRLLWHVLADSRIFVRVKNKSLLDASNMLTPANGKRVTVEEMNPWR